LKGQDCSELFVSEVVFGESSLTLNDPNNNFVPITNYALEIYNPTEDSIDLSSYKIELFTFDTVETEITLEGVILPETAMVLSTPSADSLIRSKADLLSSNLTFGNHVMVQIVKEGTGVIDVVGRLGLEEEIGIFTLDTLINNPSILQAVEFDLRFLRGLNVRRAASVLEGKTTFITSELLHDWTIYPNAFVEDLGDHRCACKSGTGVVNWQGIDFFAPEVVTAENDEEPIMGTVSVVGLDPGEEVELWIIDVFHEYDEPEAGDATTFVDFEFDPFLGAELTSSNPSEIVEISKQVINDEECEGNEGKGFVISILDGPFDVLVGNAFLFDILITDEEDCINSTYDAEYLNALISVTPTIVTNRASLVVEENSLSIQGIRVFTANGQLLKQIPVDGRSGGTIDLDLSYLPVRGYYLIAIQTNKGLITKRIIKQ
jgi:hypothetical protein